MVSVVQGAGVRPWAQLLADAPDPIVVAADLPRPDRVGGEVAGVPVALDAEALGSLAAATGTPRSVVLLAAWVALLARTTDRSTVLLGVGEDLSDRQLIVRVDVDLDAALSALVASVVGALDQARALGAITVTEVLRQLHASPGTDKHPVFQVAAGTWSPSPGAWPVRAPGVVPPDMVLCADVDGAQVRARLDHPTSVASTKHVERFAGHLTRLLDAAAADPARPVAELPMMSPAELAQLTGWNATARAHDGSAPLAARIEAQVRATPDHPAVEYLGESVSYAELWRRAERLAAVLQGHGVGPDVTVAICLERSIAMTVAVLGVLRAGGAYVPVDPDYPAARRAVMIEGASVAVVVTQASLVDDLPPVAAVIERVDEQGHPESVATKVAAPCAATGAHLGYVVFTSGSTGRPKGVALSQAALDNLLAWQLRRPQSVGGARTLQFSSLSFDVSFQEIFSTWAAGGTLVLVSDPVRRDPLSLLEHLQEHAVERLFLPNVALRGLAAAVRSTGRKPARLREVYTAGEPLQVDATLVSMMEALPAVVLENQYGPSESHVATARTLAGAAQTWPVLPPVGAPIDNTETFVVDSRGQLRPIGVPGELYLGGTCLARGYLGQDEMTAERFVELSLPTARSTRLYRTGDLARWREDGQLDLLGRLDGQVKFRGFRIEPGEVGTVLSGCPGVEQCVAAVVDHPVGGPRLTAYLLPEDPRTPPDLASVHSWARDQLPSHMVPSHYSIVTGFPLTSSGKLDLRALPEVDFDRRILSTPYVEPTDPQERLLVEIWRSVLGVATVGIRDDWFALGGDSLAAAEMVEQVHGQLGVELPLGALAQGPTVSELAAVIRGDAAETFRSLVPLRISGQRAPLFVVHGGSGNVASFPRLAKALPTDQPVYALQWTGLDGSRGDRTIEAMAERYLGEVREVQPHGPYRLAGQCVGGLVAREMTRRLLADGEEVDVLVLWDSPHLGSSAYTRGRHPLLRELLVVRDARRAKLRVAVRTALRRRIAPADRNRHGTLAMIAAVWSHDPGRPPVARTLYFSSGVADAHKLALTGEWSDDVLGWSTEESELLTIHRVTGEHNEIMYEPESVSLLEQALFGNDRPSTTREL